MTPIEPLRAGGLRGLARRALCLAAAVSWFVVAAPGSAAKAQTAAAPGRVAVLLSIDGAIGPASADYVLRGLAKASEQQAAVVVLRMDTPGGLDTSMREIIRAILSSPIPVLSYVGPSGARAASAGTYILYASHVAAMAPGTNLGAATPVSLGGGGGSPLPGREPAPADPAASAASAPGDNPRAAGRNASEAKAVNDAVAYIRSLANLHGRNAQWAEQAVREAASLSASDALDRNVIDLIAGSVPELLRKAHGRTVRIGNDKQTLDTAQLEVRAADPDLRSRVLGVLTNPNLALILMMIGIYGLLFEFMNPGALYPGTIGAISLLLGLYALSALPLSYAGLALLVLGIGLMVAEAFTPALGILGIGGVIAFVLGGALLIDTEAPGFALSLPLLGAVAATGLAFSLLVARLALSNRKRRVVSGTEAMVGGPARVLDWAGERGHVFADGERWSAIGAAGLQPGQTVRVRAVHGVVVEVVADGGVAAAGAAMPPVPH